MVALNQEDEDAPTSCCCFWRLLLGCSFDPDSLAFLPAVSSTAACKPIALQLYIVRLSDQGLRTTIDGIAATLMI